MTWQSGGPCTHVQIILNVFALHNVRLRYMVINCQVKVGAQRWFDLSIHIYMYMCKSLRTEQKLAFKFTPNSQAVVCDCPQWSVERVRGVGRGSDQGRTVSQHPVQRTHHRDFPLTRPAGHRCLSNTFFPKSSFGRVTKAYYGDGQRGC